MTEPVLLAHLAGCLRILLVLLVLVGSQGCASLPKRTAATQPDLPLFDLSQYESVQKRAGQNEKITVVVAISGGGFRAANLGLGALLAMEQIEFTLDKKKTNLLAEVDYFTTVSGGGYAPGLYLQGLLSAPLEMRGSFRLDEHLRRRKQGKKIESDRLSSVQKTLFWRIAGYLFYPGVIGGQLDRGDLLQNRLDTTILKRDGCDPDQARSNGFCSWTLDDVFKPPGIAPITPYWIANATNYTNGEIFSFTPDNLCSRNVARYKHQLGDGETGCPSVETGQHPSPKPLAHAVPLALGMRTSSNFPVGLPTTTLTLNDKTNLQLSDGGQADNLAFYSALEILFQDAQTAKAREPGRDGAVPKRILILIDAFRGSLGNSEATEGSPNFAQAALRSPSLPLDALRSRIRSSVSQIGVNRRSEIDSVLADQNLAVAYINIDQEDYARDVGTTLWLDEEKQDGLIVAGFRQAYATLKGSCTKKFLLEPVGISINCDKNDGGRELFSELGMIEFNSGLLDKRKSDVLSLRTRAIKDLAVTVSGLHSSLDAELTRQQNADALQQKVSEAEQKFEQATEARGARAKQSAMAQHHQGSDLYGVASDFAALYADLAQMPDSRRKEEARLLACRSNKLYQLSGFKRPLKPLPRATCADVRVTLASSATYGLLAFLLAGSENLVEGCSREWARFPVCQDVWSLRNQAKQALDIYGKELRRPLAQPLDLLEDPEPVTAQCDILEALEVSIRAIHLASVSGNDEFDAMMQGEPDQRRRASDVALLDDLRRLPKTYADIRRNCADLVFKSAEKNAPLHASLGAMNTAVENAQCVLESYQPELDRKPARFRTQVDELFDNSGTEMFCKSPITALPASRAPELPRGNSTSRN